VALVKRFDGEFPERFAEELFAYLNIPEKEFPVASRCFEQPIMDRRYFMHLVDRFPLPASVEVRGRRVAAAAHRLAACDDAR
jgi:hypothetical protein